MVSWDLVAVLVSRAVPVALEPNLVDSSANGLGVAYVAFASLPTVCVQKVVLLSIHGQRNRISLKGVGEVVPSCLTRGPLDQHLPSSLG